MADALDCSSGRSRSPSRHDLVPELARLHHLRGNILFPRGKIEGCSLERFEDATGLKLTDANGIKDELPPITTFLNRLLALTIDLQNVLFTVFEQLLTREDLARAAGPSSTVNVTGRRSRRT